MKIYAWCLMSSHLHLIISSPDNYRLYEFFRDFKKFTSKEIIRLLSQINESRKDWVLDSFIRAGEQLKRIKNFKVWKDSNHPIELDTNIFIQQKLNYIHNTPVNAEIVEEPHLYLYSSARNYAGFKGLLDLEIIDE